jgi:hypothetical protein
LGLGNPPRRTVMDLTPEQEAEAQRIFATLRETTDADLLALARLLASKSDGEVFGQTEFEVRDRVHAIGAKAIETTLAGRKKRGTRGAASAANSATGRPGSRGTRPAGS